MSEKPPQSEATIDLLALIRVGDKVALGRLVERYDARLRGAVHSMLRREGRRGLSTADYVNEAWQETLRELIEFEHRGEGSLLRRLKEIARRRILHEAKRPRPALIEELVCGGDCSVADSAHEQVRELLPQDRGFLHERLDVALAALPREQYQACVLHLMEGLSHARIAAELGISVGASRMLVHRAKEKLRDLLGPKLRDICPELYGGNTPLAGDGEAEPSVAGLS